ncbi:MAG: NB-ARC domain-containing protein [Cyanobacteria bacterium J06634_5]
MSEIKIFLASSSELKSDRDQFEIFINRRNKALRDQCIFLHLVIWEDFLDAMSADGLQSEYNKAVEDCDIFVMLVQNKVGPFTAEEFDHAFGQFSETKRPLIYTYFKPSTTRDREALQSLWAFEDKLKALKHYKTEYETIEGLREHFGNQLKKLKDEGFFTAETQPRQSRRKSLVEQYRVPLQMPPLPDHFVERPEPQAAVRAQLLCENDKGGTLVVSAIYGLGGIGKSVLASKLTHEQAVQDYFADGILWVTLGQNPDILPLLSGWIQALGDHDYKPTAIESASNHLRTLLYDKCILLVVDDVWNPAHLEPFRVGGDKSRVMVTTREARIPDADLHRLDVMDEDQALDLMTQKIKEPLTKRARGQALAFAGRVGYLPLALELAASQIEDGVTWPELLEDFTAEVSRLEALDIYARGEMPDDEKRRKYSLLACFNLSLRQLSPEQLRQFAWLGVVPEDVSLTQAMAETLWAVSGRQAGSILRTFRAKSLVLQGAKQQGASEGDARPSYRMHDLMHDLAQQLLQQPVEPEGEDGLPGLGLSVAAAHGALLDRYGAKAETEEDGRVQWHTLTDDGYIFAHLTWHMAQAQRPGAIHGLLCASNWAGRNGWYEACDAIGKPAGFVNDLGRAWGLAVDAYEATPGKAVALLYRYGLMRASLNSLASKVPAEMVGGLVKEGYWQAAQGLAYAQQAQNPWHRAACISAIVPYMPKALLPEVLKTVGQIKAAAYRSYVLSKLAERFPEVWADVLDAIQTIQDRYGQHRQETKGFSYRALALTRIIKWLPVNYLSTALDIAQKIQDPADKAIALIALATKREVLWPEVLLIIREIKDEDNRSRALRAMAQRLPELWPEALSIIREIKCEDDRSNVPNAISEHLSSDLWPKALSIIHEIKDEDNRTDVLSEISEHLSSELWPEALKITNEIKNESYRSWTLRQIAEHLPSELWPEALVIICEIQDEDDRVSILSEISEHLPSGLWPEALAITREMKDEDNRASTLSGLSEHLPPELWPEALAITREIKDKDVRSIALSAMAHHLPELWSEALAITRAMKNEFYRSSALHVMAQHLPSELWSEVLMITREIKDESYRLRALHAIEEHLPSELWSEALTITGEIKDEFYRSIALSAIAQHLPTGLLSTAIAMIWDIQDNYFRAQALQAFLPALEQLSIPFHEWAKMLDIIAYQNRSELLTALPDSRPIVTRLGDDNTFPAILQAVRDVCRQWP